MGYKIDKNWLLKNSDKEDNLNISAGSLNFSTVGFRKTKTEKTSRPYAPRVKSTGTPHKRRAKKAS